MSDNAPYIHCGSLRSDPTQKVYFKPAGTSFGHLRHIIDETVFRKRILRHFKDLVDATTQIALPTTRYEALISKKKKALRIYWDRKSSRSGTRKKSSAKKKNSERVVKSRYWVIESAERGHTPDDERESEDDAPDDHQDAMMADYDSLPELDLGVHSEEEDPKDEPDEADDEEENEEDVENLEDEEEEDAKEEEEGVEEAESDDENQRGELTHESWDHAMAEEDVTDQSEAVEDWHIRSKPENMSSKKYKSLCNKFKNFRRRRMAPCWALLNSLAVMKMTPAEILLKYFTGQLDGNGRVEGGRFGKVPFSTAIQASMLHYGCWVGQKPIKQASDELVDQKISRITESEALKRHFVLITQMPLPRELVAFINELSPLGEQRSGNVPDEEEPAARVESINEDERGGTVAGEVSDKEVTETLSRSDKHLKASGMSPAQILIEYFDGRLDGSKQGKHVVDGKNCGSFSHSMAISASFRHYGYAVAHKELLKASQQLADKKIDCIAESKTLKKKIRQVANVHLPPELLPLINKLLPLNAQRAQTEQEMEHPSEEQDEDIEISPDVGGHDQTPKDQDTAENSDHKQKRSIEEVPRIHRLSGPDIMRVALADMNLSAAEVIVGYMKGTLSSAGTTPSGNHLAVDAVKASFHYFGFIAEENAIIEARADFASGRVTKISNSNAWQNSIKHYEPYLLPPAVELALSDLKPHFRPFLEPKPKTEDEVLEDAPQLPMRPRESRSPPQDRHLPKTTPSISEAQPVILPSPRNTPKKEPRPTSSPVLPNAQSPAHMFSVNGNGFRIEVIDLTSEDEMIVDVRPDSSSGSEKKAAVSLGRGRKQAISKPAASQVMPERERERSKARKRPRNDSESGLYSDSDTELMVAKPLQPLPAEPFMQRSASSVIASSGYTVATKESSQYRRGFRRARSIKMEKERTPKKSSPKKKNQAQKEQTGTLSKKQKTGVEVKSNKNHLEEWAERLFEKR